MKRFDTLLITLTLLILMVMNSHFAEAKSTAKPSSIKVAIGDNVVPFQYLDENKQPAGLVVDVWKLWQQKTGIDVEFVASSWPETVTNLTTGKVQVHGALSYNTEREKIFDFSGFIYSVAVSVYVHKDLVSVSSINDLTPVLVGVIKNTAFEKKLRDKNPNISFRYFDSRNEMLDAAANGEIKTFVTFDYLSFRHHRLADLNHQYPAYRRINIEPITVNYAVKKGNTELQSIIDQGFASVSEQERNNIERKWLGVDNDDTTLLLGVSTGNEPYMGVTPSGEATGLFVDLWKSWAEKTKTKIEFMPNTMELALLAVKKGKSHVHIGYPESEVVGSGQPRAHHLYSVFSNLFVKEDYDVSLGIKQLNGKKIGLFVTAPYKSEFIQTYPDIEVEWFQNLDDMLRAAINGDIDAFISSKQTGRARLVKNNVQNVFRVVQDINYETKIYSIVNRQNIALIDKIDQGFSLIPHDELLEIERRWIKDEDAQFFHNNYLKFKLTEQEQNWLIDVPELTVGIVENWEPYEKMASDGTASGINPDIFALASKFTGQKYNFKAYPNWGQLLSAFRRGDVDMVANIGETEERKQFADFTSSYWNTPWSIITETSVEPFDNIARLRGHSLAVIKDYQIINAVHNLYPDIIITVVDDIEAGIELLKQQRVLGVLDSMMSAAHHLQKNDLYQYKVHVMKDLPYGTSHLGIRKGLNVQAGIMQKVVDAITEQDRKDIMNKWFKVEVEAGISYQEYWRNITTALVIAGLIIVFVMSWNRRLQSEIKKRQRAERKLHQLATHDALTGLPNRNLLYDRISQAISSHNRTGKHLALMFLDLDGFKQVNDSYGHDEGDSLLKEVATRLRHIVRASDTVARIGGDEFILLVTNLENASQAAYVAEKAILDISEPFKLPSGEAHIGVSIGIACFPSDADSINELLKLADDAMYKVKQKGKNNYMFV